MKWLLIVTGVFYLFTSTSAYGQGAIEISDILEKENDISVSDINKVNNKLTVEDTLKGWDVDWISSLNITQASYDNWSQGGVNIISTTVATILDLKYRHEHFAYYLATNLKYGKAWLDLDKIRKTDDRMAISNKFSYLFNDSRWSLFFNINFSSQFDKGYNYNVSKESPPKLISGFLSPAYLFQIGGLAFKPTNYLTTEGGLALKETIVINNSLSNRYGLVPGDKLLFEPGYSVVISLDKEISRKIQLQSSIESFSNLKQSFKKTDINFNSEITGHINNLLSMSFQFSLVYDADYSRRLQIKQVLSAGLSINIL